MFNRDTFEPQHVYEEMYRKWNMSKKRKRNKMNEITNTPETAPVREVIGTNPDGTPIYREETVQTAEHTGELQENLGNAGG